MTAFYKTKGWYKSKTMWASIVTVMLGVLSLFGVGEGLEAGPIVDFLFIVSGIVAGYGRVTADSKIGVTTE